jgi:hypothetical protein
VVNPAQGVKVVHGVLAKWKGFESFPRKTFENKNLKKKEKKS